ncbi:hypothetical protein C6500_12635 [Candidatus Poribacteria bacterium]|nr:MAG: hypothetical protein C6500_12635 [Candidatus Poribacteria bacterium]
MNNINFQKHWKNVQLKEIASLRRESIQPENDLCLNYVGLEHIDSGESQLKRWGNASEVKSTKNRFYADDILYGKLRAYLDKAVIAEMEGICSTDILVVTANSKTIPRFLVYLLHTQPLISHAVATSTGVNHPRTSWNSLGEFTLALPPLPEQRAIAHVLQTLQEAKSARQHEIALERERKAALMDHLFSHGTKGESRKQTEIGEIPKSWKVVQTGKVGKIVTGNTPKTSVPEYYGGPYMFISPGDISEPQYVTETNKYVSAEGLKVLRPLPRDSVLVVCIGSTIGKTAMTSTEQSATNQQINAIIPNAKAFSHYVYYAVTYRSRSLPALAGRAAVPIVKKSSFAKFLIPFPPLCEQHTIAQVLQTIDERIMALGKEVQHLEELFHAMLDELMTGKRSAVPLIEDGGV